MSGIISLVTLASHFTLLKRHGSRNGFTLPIVCYCNGTQVTGCMKDLFALGDCPVSPEPGIQGPVTSIVILLRRNEC